MSAPDPKPAKRVKDPKLMRQLHDEYAFHPCAVCNARPGAMLHHIKYRSRGGGDTRENLQWVCAFCHAEIHS